MIISIGNLTLLHFLVAALNTDAVFITNLALMSMYTKCITHTTLLYNLTCQQNSKIGACVNMSFYILVKL